MRPELHGIMKVIADDGGWHDGAMAATSTGVEDGRMRGWLLWIHTTGAGANLMGTKHGLSMPYDDILSYEQGRGGWAPKVREMLLTVEGRGDLTFRGGRTFIDDLIRLFGFVVPGG